MKIITTVLLAMSLQLGGMASTASTNTSMASTASTNTSVEAEHTLDLVGIMALSSEPARADLIPEVTSSDIARSQKMMVANVPALDETFVFHKGQRWDGPTTYFAGVKIANTYDVFTHPGRFTWGEWTTWIGGIATMYFIADEQEWFSSSSSGNPIPDPDPASATASSASGRTATLVNQTGNFRIHIQDDESGSGSITIEGTHPQDQP